MPLFFFLFIITMLLPALWPQIDLLASGLFYRPGQGFFLADNLFFVSLHWLAYYGARVLGVAFAALAAGAYFQQNRTNSPPLAGGVRGGVGCGPREHNGEYGIALTDDPAPRGTATCNTICQIGDRVSRKGRGIALLYLDAKAWLFLLLALIIAPGLVANAGFKDHWGRARPRETAAFGGTESFTPFYVPQFQKAHSNGSFVSGDGAFGFFLPVFAYVVPRRFASRTFWACMGAGGLFGLARIVMGAHFLSDVIYAAFFMLLSVACVHAALYGNRETATRWRSFFKALKP